MKIIYLAQNHEKDEALTLKESHFSHWNVGWICRKHNVISFKSIDARNTNRYLIGEINKNGENVKNLPNWSPANPSRQTHCHGGSSYEGHLSFDSIDRAVAYLKRFYQVIACASNLNENQEWINNLISCEIPATESPSDRSLLRPSNESINNTSKYNIFSPSTTELNLFSSTTKNTIDDKFLQKVRALNIDKAMSNSLRAALQRNKVYATNTYPRDRSKFRLAWSKIMAEVSDNYMNPVDDEAHCNTIAGISQELSINFGSILEGGKLRFGTAQKAFNLYLKFLWRLGIIPSPPHCPVDGIVLKRAGIAGSWTQSDSMEEYMRWINTLRELAPPLTLADWEYILWNGDSN